MKKLFLIITLAHLLLTQAAQAAPDITNLAAKALLSSTCALVAYKAYHAPIRRVRVPITVSTQTIPSLLFTQAAQSIPKLCTAYILGHVATSTMVPWESVRTMASQMIPQMCFNFVALSTCGLSISTAPLTTYQVLKSLTLSSASTITVLYLVQNGLMPKF